VESGARERGSDASQEQNACPDFASNVPSKSLDQLVAKSANCGETPRQTWRFATPPIGSKELAVTNLREKALARQWLWPA